MDKIFVILGAIWMLIGIGNIVCMPWGSNNPTILIMGLLVNGIFFLFPGLVVIGIGAMLEKKKKKEAE